MNPLNPLNRQADSFQPLFNGRDLSGWVSVNCAPETWSVRDGMIHSTGKPICELRTDRMYENFVLELEYKHLEPGGNAGLFVWGDALTARGTPFVRAIEVQILDGRNTDNYTSHGDMFSIHGATMTPDRPHPNGWERSLPSASAAPSRPGSGTTTASRPRTGRSSWPSTARRSRAVTTSRRARATSTSSRKAGVVDYRNIRIRELPSAGTLPPNHIAQADEGFVSLYTGTDFRGWTYPTGHEGHWVSKDWVIAYDGKSEAADKDLWTERAFGDVMVIADWRRSAPGDALPIGLAGVELPEQARSAIQRVMSVKTEKPRWRRAILTKRGGRLSLTIDGDAVFQDLDVPAAKGRGAIGLRHDGTPIEFASIFVKE